MGSVTEHLLRLLETYVRRHRLVVWYDPKDHYAAVIATLTLPNTTVLCYGGSYFELRFKIEPFLTQYPDSNLIIYVNKDRLQTDYALAEVEAVGIILEPGASEERDTALASIGRAALNQILPAQVLEELLQTENRSLADLDRIAQGMSSVPGALVAIYGSSASISDIALNFMVDSKFDQELSTKSAYVELIVLLANTFGLPERELQAPTNLRKRLIYHILLIDLRASLSGQFSLDELDTKTTHASPTQVEACQQIIKRWRDSISYRASYGDAARRVEQALSVFDSVLPLEAWQKVQTFPTIEKFLIEGAERKIMEGNYMEAIRLAEQRQDSFWNTGENALRWLLISTTASMLLLCIEIEKQLKLPTLSADEMIKLYSEGTEENKEPWCSLDMLHRHLEQLRAKLGSTLPSDQIVLKARSAYTRVTDHLAERFSEALAKAQFHVQEVTQQINIFRKYVAPALQQGRVVYFWVDALRFEMARELVGELSQIGQVSLLPAQAALPTITPVGMAALLPQAERGLGLVEIDGVLTVEVNNRFLKNRQDRVSYLTQHSGYITEVFTLENVLKLSRTTKQRIKQAQLVVVTSQEIDQMAEQQVSHVARNVMDEQLKSIKAALSNLVGLGVSNFVIAADHGFLFDDELSRDMLIDPPGGQTVKLNQRAWIGRGGQTPAACLRIKVSDAGIGGDLELVFPRGLAGFRRRGGVEPYCHGGISLQELVIPVIIIQLAQKQN